MATIRFNTSLDPRGALRGAKELRDRIAGRPIELTISRKSLAQPLGRITGDVAEFTKSLQAATARVTAFGATSGGIIAVSQAISQVAKSVIEVDKQLIELNTFLGQSEAKLGAVGDSLFKIAKNTASSFADTAEAAKEFARQGLSVEETLKRTNDALVLSRISGLGAAESVNALTTAINSFNKSGLTSSEIINKLVKVDTNFAVSAADLAQALTRVGSAAQDSGVSFEQLISVVTTAQQTTGRGGAVIGNALKTIFTRLKRPEVLDQLQQLGVAVKDQNGALLDGVEILKNYTAATRNLSQIEKARNDELLGGVYQINQLKALTNDLAKGNGIYSRSLQIANDATDDAIQKNKELNKSLSAIIQNTKTNFQQRGGAIGDPILRPLVQRGANIANILLNNSDVTKNQTGKEGEDIGQSFGQAFLKGVGEAIAGPGLILVGALGVNIGKRLFSFVAEASKVLLNINSSLSNTLSLEQAISNTLSQQPKIIDAVAKGQLTREQAAAQLVRLFAQQNQQLLVQKNIASGLAQTFARSGFIASPEYGIYQGRRGRRSDGYIPNYALEQERTEAISRGASNPIPYFAKVTIGGKEQIAAVNNQEQIIPRFGGGRDTAIIPNYMPLEMVSRTASKGYIPNYADQVKYYSSNAELREIIKNQKPGQKFFSLSYLTEAGLNKTENFDEASIVRKATSQSNVRRDLIKGKAPPKGFATWQEFWDARMIAPIRRTQIDPSNPNDKGFRSRRLDRVVEAKIGGVRYLPSPELAAKNSLTRSSNARQLRGMGISNLGSFSQALTNAKNVGEVDVLLAQMFSGLKSNRRSAGYIPNFAPTRSFSPSRRVSSNMPSVAGGQQAVPEKTAGQFVGGSAISSALYFLLPSIAGGFANEQNQEFISGGIKGSALLLALNEIAKGFKAGGARGAAGAAVGAGLTTAFAFSQANQLKENIKTQTFDKARDRSLNSFNKLTENISGLAQTISDLDSLYADPSARPEALIKLARRQEDLLKKLSTGNPEAAVAFRLAQTPQARQNALQDALEKAQKEQSISKTVTDFAQLTTSERDAKAVTAFFRDLAGQIPSNFNIQKANTGDIQSFLKQAGLDKATGIFTQSKEGNKIAAQFIEFLRVQEKITQAAKDNEAEIRKAQKPLLELRTNLEKSQALRTASSQARSGFLDNLEKFTGSFGERAGLEAKRKIDTFTESKSEREVFSNRLFVESQNLSNPAIKGMIQLLSAQGPSEKTANFIKQSIADNIGNPYAQADVEILKRILAQNSTSANRLDTIAKIAEIQKQYSLRALTLQEKLSFAGGIKTSIDASARVSSFQETQRGALQYQLGSMLGSRETQVAGLTNFASNLKGKYAGLFEDQAGQAAFGNIRNILTQSRAKDIQESLMRDAITARSIGRTDLASLLERKASPANSGQIFEMARLQAEQQLGLNPSIVDTTLTEFGGAEAKSREEKRVEDEKAKNEEKKIAPQINQITETFNNLITRLQEPFQQSVQNAFGKGLEITNATLIVKNLDSSSESQRSAPPSAEETAAFRAERDARKAQYSSQSGGFIPNFSNPLIDSLNRERSALVNRGYNPVMPVSAGYIPNFAAQIQVGQSSKLVNSRNPMGLAVTNTVDEPNGLASIGLASGGYIPNFAKGKGRLSKKEQEALQNELKALQGDISETAPALESTPGSDPQTLKQQKIIQEDIQGLEEARTQSLEKGYESGVNKPIEDVFLRDVKRITNAFQVEQANNLIKEIEGQIKTTETQISSYKPNSKSKKFISLQQNLKDLNERLETLKTARESITDVGGPLTNYEELQSRLSRIKKSQVDIQFDAQGKVVLRTNFSDPLDYLEEKEVTEKQAERLLKEESKLQQAQEKAARGAYSGTTDYAVAQSTLRKNKKLTPAESLAQLKEDLASMREAQVGTEFSTQENKDRAVKKLEDLISKVETRLKATGVNLNLSGKDPAVEKTGFTKLANTLLGKSQAKTEAGFEAALSEKQASQLGEQILRTSVENPQSSFAPAITQKIKEYQEKQAQESQEAVRRLVERSAYKSPTATQESKLITPPIASSVGSQSEIAQKQAETTIPPSLLFTDEQFQARRVQAEMARREAAKKLKDQRKADYMARIMPKESESLINDPNKQVRIKGQYEKQFASLLDKEEKRKAAEVQSLWKDLLDKQEKQNKEEARKQRRQQKLLSKVPLEFVSPLGVSANQFTSAGPGVFFKGSFADAIFKQQQDKLTLDISQRQGFRKLKQNLVQNPDLAVALLGENYQSILSNQKSFNAWNEASGKSILGFTKSGSLLASLSRPQQVAANVALGGSRPTLPVFSQPPAGGPPGGVPPGGVPPGGVPPGGVPPGGVPPGGVPPGGVPPGGVVPTGRNRRFSLGNFLYKFSREALGYRSQYNIDRSAAQLLALEKDLSRRASLSPEIKNLYVQDFLDKQGPFAQRVQQRSEELLTKQNTIFTPKEIRSLLGNFTGTNYEALIKTQSELGKAVAEGKLTPEQAIKTQNDIFLRDRNLTINEYSGLLKTFSSLTDRNVSNYKSGLEFYSDVLAGRNPDYETSREAIGKRLGEDRLKKASERVKKLGITQDPNLVSQQNPYGIKIAEGGVDFGNFELNLIKSINQNQNLTKAQKDQKTKEIRNKFADLEVKEKSKAAKNFGFEYNSLTGEIEPKGSRAANKTQAQQAAELEAKGKLGVSPKGGQIFSKGLKAGGLGLALTGAYETFFGKDQPFMRAINSGDNLTASLLLLQNAAALVGAVSPFEKFQNKFKLGEIGAAKVGAVGFGLAGGIGSAMQAVEEFAGDKKLKGFVSTFEALTSLGAGGAGLAGQNILSTRLFALGSGVSLAKQIASSEDFQLVKFSEADKRKGFLAKLATGTSLALTGENVFDDSKKTTDVLASVAGDVFGSAFVAGMGYTGAAITTAKIGYRTGNILGEALGLDETLGTFLTGKENLGRSKLAKYGILTRTSEIIGADGEARPAFKSDEEYKKYLKEELLKGTPEEYRAGGYIPNFDKGLASAFLNEQYSILNKPDYAGYRNATPMMSSVYPNTMINSAEMEIPAERVYAAMGFPGAKPRDPSQTHAILNPAQQEALGMTKNASQGFVPNFSNEEFMKSMSVAMKNGMMAAFADGFLPNFAPSSSNSVVINSNNSNQASFDANSSVMKRVVGVLMDMYPQQMASIGPDITKMI
jgi:TP901 family phage tail tape measure protein